MTHEELTEEQLEALAERSIRVKDEILEVLGGEETRIGLSALTAAAGEIICSTAPSLDEAVNAVAMFSASMVTLIRMADEEGECYWQSHAGETRQ
jgi:hypothetical protein